MSSNLLSFSVFLYFFNNLLDESGGGRGVTLVKEDELGVVILVKEGEPGGLGELGGPGGPGSLGGPGSIGNPAKLSLISFILLRLLLDN